MTKTNATKEACTKTALVATSLLLILGTATPSAQAMAPLLPVLTGNVCEFAQEGLMINFETRVLSLLANKVSPCGAGGEACDGGVKVKPDVVVCGFVVCDDATSGCGHGCEGPAIQTSPSTKVCGVTVCGPTSGTTVCGHTVRACNLATEGVGVVVDGSSLCTTLPTPCTAPSIGVNPVCANLTLCTGPTYGAKVNGIGVCTGIPPPPPVVVCTGPTYGATVNGIGACTTIPTITLCLGPSSYGAKVNGIGACETPPSITTCLGPSYGAHVGSIGTCITPPPIQLCLGPTYGATVGGIGACAPVPTAGLCSPPNTIGATVNGSGACIPNPCLMLVGSQPGALLVVCGIPVGSDDQDDDGATDTAEENAGSNPTFATSAPGTDDDGDGAPNSAEVQAVTTQGRAACTGSYGTVYSAACGGYTTPSGGSASSLSFVDAANQVWVWDAYCASASQGAFAACKGASSNYAASSTLYSGSFTGDGYGWRHVTNVPSLGPQNVPIVLPCQAFEADDDEDGVAVYRFCSSTLTVQPNGSTSTTENGPFTQTGDPNDSDPASPIPPIPGVCPVPSAGVEPDCHTAEACEEGVGAQVDNIGTCQPLPEPCPTPSAGFEPDCHTASICEEGVGLQVDGAGPCQPIPAVCQFPSVGAEPDCHTAATCDPPNSFGVMVDNVGSCQPNPCPEPVDSQEGALIVVCGVPVSGICQEGVTVNGPTQACGAVVCAEPLLTTTPVSVCGNPVPDPCPTPIGSAEGSLVVVCGIPIPNLLPGQCPDGKVGAVVANVQACLAPPAPCSEDKVGVVSPLCISTPVDDCESGFGGTVRGVAACVTVCPPNTGGISPGLCFPTLESCHQSFGVMFNSFQGLCLPSCPLGATICIPGALELDPCPSGSVGAIVNGQFVCIGSDPTSSETCPPGKYGLVFLDQEACFEV